MIVTFLCRNEKVWQSECRYGDLGLVVYPGPAFDEVQVSALPNGPAWVVRKIEEVKVPLYTPVVISLKWLYDHDNS